VSINPICRARAALTCSCAWLALLAASPALAAAADEVVVTGKLEQSLPEELARFGNRLTIVTPEQIERGGFNDIGQTLQMSVPGLYIANRGGPFSYVDVSLQGSRPGEVLFLIDGVRISNRLYSITMPLDTVPAHMVDHVEVLDGGQGLFYGTQAVAGVVNIWTRPFTDKLTGKLAVGGDTNHSWDVSGYASGRIGQHQLVVYASHDQSTGFQLFRTPDIQPSATDFHRSYRLNVAGLKYGYDLSEALRFSASYQHTEGFVDSIRPFDVASAINQRNEEIATVKLDWTPSQTVQLFLKGYYHDWDSHYAETDNTSSGPVVVDDHEFWGFWDYGANAVAKITPRQGLETYLGYDFQSYWGKDDVLLIADQNEHTHAVFAQVRITPDMLARTHLAAGVRYNAPSQGQGATVWNVSGQFDISDNLFVRATGGTSFRLPTAEELFAIDPINNGEVGNPNLKPEHSSSINGSIGGRFPLMDGAITWEAIGFWRQTTDLIDLSGDTPDPDVFTFINLPDKVTVKGVELALRADLSPSLGLNASYTHSDATQTGSGLQLAGIPRDIASGGLDWHPVDLPIGASVQGNWVGSVVDNVSGGVGRVDRGNYVVVDLNAYVEFGKDRRHRISARLENLLDEDYSTRISRSFNDNTGVAYPYGVRGVPRTLHVKYGYSF
jgi:outer membrane cobalamin receptor